MDPILARILDEAQARQLPALIEEWAETGDDRSWLARALRIDLALLTERPELVVPCLYRRCAFVGGDDERGFYDERTPPPVDFAALRETVQWWVAHAPRPWLRPLRPPPVPLDGAVIEEYRTSVAGTLWVADDRIGVAGKDAHVAWERSMGRRIDGARARRVEPAGPSPWQMSHSASTWGRLVLERDDQRIDLALGEDQIVRTVHTLTDELVLALGDELDDDDFYALVDTRRARIRWQHAGRAVAFTLRDAEHLVVARENAIVTHALESGDAMTSFRLPYPGDLVLLPDGNVATRTGHVIRVWDVREAVARPQVTHPPTNSWTQAAFSPDGQRLVTGTLLCDAISGRFIANLPCNGPSGWLEGGPPRGCQWLVNGVFAELMPFHLSLWDSRDATQLHRDPERRGRIDDLARFDPTGRYHAIWHQRGPLRVYRLREGTLVAELDQPAPARLEDPHFGFSPDGETLAWQNTDGERWAMPLANPSALARLADDAEPWEPAPSIIRATDGVLVVGAAAIPSDDGAAIASPDGRSFAFLRSHYVLED